MNMKQIKSWLLVKAAMIATLFGVAANVSAEDKFYIPDFSIEAGETKELAIQFESDKVSASDPSQLEYVAFQFDIYLPEGLTIVQNRKGLPNFTFNAVRCDDHGFSPALQADGAIRVAAASMTNGYFWETSGDFVYFSVTAAADFAGDHEITMKTINFSDIKGKRTILPDVTTKVTGPAAGVAVTGITLDKATAEVTEGESLTLVATVAPDNATDKTVVWSSSDETVATVKDGVVTTLKAGEATITAKAGEQTATCVVTVKAKVIAVTGITLDKATAEVTEGESLTLVATVAPDNATDKTVVWSSSDETVATVKDGVVTTLKAGEATITAKAGEQTATCVVTVKENDSNAAQVTVFDFEDDNILFTCDSRISASVVSGEQTIKGTNENTITLASKAVRFAGANNAQNGYSFAHYDFSSLVEKAKTVTVEFDYWNTDGARAIISLGDASVRGTTGNSSKNTYSNKGAIFALGSDKNNALLNGAKLSKADYCDKWLVVSVAVDVLNATYSYSIKDKATGTEIKSASDIAYYSSEALACSQIDLFGYINNSTPALLDNIVITVEKDNRVYADYKVLYVDEAGVEIKEAAVRNGAANEAAGIVELDKESFKNADASKKYIYKSDDSEGKTIAEDGSTVITVTFREAAKYNYSVEAIDDSGSLALTLGSYSDFEGENAKAPYYAYVLNEGVFYEAAAVNKEYNKYITLTQDNMKVQVAYAKSAIENVVYYQEAENVEGLTKATNGNTGIRSSNSASAYAAEADVVLTNLAPGKYKMTAVICDAKTDKSGVFSFAAATDTILTVKTTDVNWTSGTSAEFTVTATTPISLLKGGNDMQAVDFFYIQKTGDVAPRFDLTAYNDTVAWAKEVKATLNAEDATEAELIVTIDDFIASAAQWLEETLADPEATQDDVNFIAQDLKLQVNAVMERLPILKLWPEAEALRMEADSVYASYTEPTDEAGLVNALRSFPRSPMFIMNVEELQTAIETLKTALAAFIAENNTPEGAKIAYLNKEGDANDAIYDALVAGGYAVDALAYADSTLTAEMIEANLADYDVVVLGGSTGSGVNLAKTYTQLLGKVNVLSTKAFWYAAPGDGGSKGTNPGTADAPSLNMVKAAGYEEHPIYAGIEGNEFAVFVEHADERTSGRYLQGNGSFGNNTPAQATIGTTNGANCIGEAWVDGKGYIIIPVDGLQPSGYLTADGAQLFVNAVDYLIAGEQFEYNLVEGVRVEVAQWPADIYDLSGRMIKKAATSLEGLDKGLYFIQGKKVLVK